MPEYGEPLSEREKEIMRLVATGVTNREVAYRLGISTNTVKVHLRNVFTKLGAESRTEATMIAVQEGWVGTGAGEAPRAGGAPEPEEGERIAEQPQVPPVPPLPRSKRAGLIAALLVAVASVIVTWPRDEPQAQEKPADLPPDPQETQQATPVEPAPSPWQERAQMPTRRAYLALAAAQGRILAIGGTTSEGVTAAVEIYDPGKDIWTRGRDKPDPVTRVSAAALGTDVYVPGGYDAGGSPTRVVEVYDVLADSWREAAPLPQPRCAYALATLGGKIYLFGGWDGEQYVATTYAYDPQTDTWTEETPMPDRRGFAAAASLENRLYVVGGYDDEMELTTCTVYTPETETWETCAPTVVGRGGVGLVHLGGQLYVIGGGGWTSYLAFNERHDPVGNTWDHFETPLEGEWRSPGVIALDNTIYAVGGWSGDYLSLNLVYEPFPFRVFIPVGHR